MSSLIALKYADIVPPSEDDKRADDQRLRDALGIEDLEIPLSILQTTSLATEEQLPCIIGKQRQGYKLIDTGADRSYSLAFDLGSTNLVAALYDNLSQTIIAETKVENPQITFGSDILTRTHHAMLGKAEALHLSLLEGVNRAIKILCDKTGISSRNIHALAAAGNTVISHFFLGLDVSRITAAPFAPVVRKPGFFKASELKLDIHPEALVYVFPNAGSYVGGDIVSGIFATGLCDTEEPCVLVDVGTNVEIVIGNRDWMLVGAGAAGPALEEGIAEIGKRAERGIIYDIEIDDNGMKCKTFDEAPPEGICGSGMVSLIYEMYREGIIGNNGKLNEKHHDVHTENGARFFKLSCLSGGGLEIKQTEIDNFLSSKAAMFTLLLVLLRSVGLGFGDIKRVYVAGALGNGIDVKKAAGIGMLPSWPVESIIPVGNTSLKGALMLLKDCSLLEREDEITDSITYKHMHDDPEFMKEFMGAVFIPHTNPDMLKV